MSTRLPSSGGGGGVSTRLPSMGRGLGGLNTLQSRVGGPTQTLSVCDFFDPCDKCEDFGLVSVTLAKMIHS